MKRSEIAFCAAIALAALAILRVAPDGALAGGQTSGWQVIRAQARQAKGIFGSSCTYDGGALSCDSEITGLTKLRIPQRVTGATVALQLTLGDFRVTPGDGAFIGAVYSKDGGKDLVMAPGQLPINSSGAKASTTLTFLVHGLDGGSTYRFRFATSSRYSTGSSSKIRGNKLAFVLQAFN